MTEHEVLTLLEKNRDERGVRHWNESCAAGSGLKSFGIGLTRLRQFGKKIGRDHGLAMKLWTSDVYEAKIIALLVDDPGLITREQIEKQVEELDGGHLAHVFSSCDSTLARTPFVREVADAWMGSPDPIRRGCGYGLLYEISKSRKKSAPDDRYFLDWIGHIERTFKKEDTTVLLAMGCALMGIGKRNRVLNAAALALARKIGPIVFDETGKCDPMDFAKHLTSEALRTRLGL